MTKNYIENYKVLEENKGKGIPVFVVRMKTPRPRSQISKLLQHRTIRRLCACDPEIFQ
ncbi:MAG: hypothetical protein HY754_16350 [Nitrospirae bacterium]|nr:hypothetical protein [Nitrospirota bacterium]